MIASRISTRFFQNYSLLNQPQPESEPVKEEDPSKSYVDKRKQKAVDIKLEIDRILEDMPAVVAKGFEEHKYILDCQFLPKLMNAQDKVRSLDSQLKREVQARDNKNEIKALQD